MTVYERSENELTNFITDDETSGLCNTSERNYFHWASNEDDRIASIQPKSVNVSTIMMNDDFFRFRVQFNRIVID